MNLIQQTHHHLLNGLQNTSKAICSHLIKEEHTLQHKIGVGLIIMIAGVYIAEIETSIAILKVIISGTGYTIHAVGAIPIVDSITHFKTKNHVKPSNEKRNGRNVSTKRNRYRIAENGIPSSFESQRVS